jgi:hypothetical protein
MNIEFLGGIPIHTDMRIAADSGKPLDYWKINDTMSSAFDNVCENLTRAAQGATPDRPTISIT